MSASPSGRRFNVGSWAKFAGATSSAVADLLIGNAVNVALVLGAVLLFAQGPLVVSLLGVLAGLAGGLGLYWLMRREVVRRKALLGSFAPGRLLLLVVVAGGYALRRPDDPAWIWVATGLGLLGILTEPLVSSMLARSRSMSTQLPGVPRVPPRPFPANRVAQAPLGAAAVGAVLAAIGAPGWVYLIVAALFAALPFVMLGYAVRALSASRQEALKITEAITAYRPEFAVFYSARNGATYQLGMWLPYLERLNKPYIVITLHPSTVAEIKKLTKAPILVPRLRTGSGRLVHMVVPTLKAAYYVQNHPSNLAFQRFKQLTHIWLNHGDSDKAANYSAQHATYDKVFVSGQQGVDRYAAHGVKIAPEQFEIVGRPQIETIEVRDTPRDPGTPPTVLYAPTWEGGQPATNYSSLSRGSTIVAALLERGATVIFRPHPHSYREPGQTAAARAIQKQLAEDARSSGRQHVYGKQAEKTWDIPACFNHSDALITDVSSVASDYLASGKPLGMVAIRQQTVAGFRREVPMARVAYVITPDLANVSEALDDLLGADPLAEQRRAYRTACLGTDLGAQAPAGFLRTSTAIIERDRQA